MSFFTTSCRKLFSERKPNFLDNKISSYTHYVTFNITDYKTVEGSLHCYNYIAMGYLYNREVTEHHFQTINYKHKRLKAKILKTHKKYL